LGDVEAFLATMRAAYEAQDERLRARFDRSLPLQDGLDDRWERARRLGFGEKVSIYNSAIVFGDVRIGANTWVGPNVILDGSGEGLTIGSSCSISAGVHIYTHDSVFWALSGGKSGYRKGRVTIGDCCYIGPQSVIAADVTIGPHSLVATNSFVNRDVPPYTIVGGTPARILGHVVLDGDVPRLVFDAPSPAPSGA